MWDKKMYKKLCTPGQEVKEEVDRNKKRGNICYGREVKVTQLKNKNKKNKKRYAARTKETCRSEHYHLVSVGSSGYFIEY